MTNSKTTKHALLLSVLSMMLCAAMLVGSTFAWFTDSVTSSRNKIVAGNLDVALYAKSGGDYTPVTAETNLFMKDALWEPGHVEVINLKVANVGTLALQYKFGINIVHEKGGTNVAGDAFQLSDYIKFALINGEKDFGAGDEGRVAAIEAAKAAAPVKLSELAVDETGVLYPNGEGESESFVTLIVYMPTDVGNEANYLNGTVAPTIDLGITLAATQTPYEIDSFSDQYDALAWDAMMEEMNKSTLAVNLTSAPDENFGVESFDTPDSKLMQVWFKDLICPDTFYENTLTFTVTGHVSKAMQMTFDFNEQCGAGESYKDIVFPGGFGGYDDIYMYAGEYRNYSDEESETFTLVGDYHPYIFTVTPGEENSNMFSYRGSLAGLIDRLSEGFRLKAGMEYNDTFTISVEWPLWTPGSDTCYIEKNGVRVPDAGNSPTGMDWADTYIGMEGGDGWCLDLWADFEVSIH